MGAYCQSWTSRAEAVTRLGWGRGEYGEGDGDRDVGDGRLLSGDFRLSLPATTLLLVSLLPRFTPFPAACCRVARRSLCANFVRCRRHGVLFNVMLANLNSAQLSSVWFALLWIQRRTRRRRRRRSRSVSWTWAPWQILNETRTRGYPRTQGRLRRRRRRRSRRSLSAAFVGSLSFSQSCVLGPCCAKT